VIGKAHHGHRRDEADPYQGRHDDDQHSPTAFGQPGYHRSAAGRHRHDAAGRLGAVRYLLHAVRHLRA
jgi:hypothetical protein